MNKPLDKFIPVSFASENRVKVTKSKFQRLGSPVWGNSGQSSVPRPLEIQRAEIDW